MIAKTILEKGKPELVKLLLEKRKELSKMRFEFLLGKLKNTSLIKKSRKEIAQIETILAGKS